MIFRPTIKRRAAMPESTIATARNDLKALVRDAQALFDEATAAGGAKAEELHSKGMEMLDHALSRAHELQEIAVKTGRKVAHDTDEYVHEHPWRAIGIAGAVGVLIGMLIARR
jgi:ElaB/YqjD/DUF883 family membrane-anchored ribosome-binding protein